CGVPAGVSSPWRKWKPTKRTQPKESSLHAGANPIQITLCTAGQRQEDELRGLVRMIRENVFLQRRELSLSRLENDQHLSACFNFALPPVMRFDARQKVRTGDELGAQCPARELTRDFQTGRGDEDD